jgi:peptide/nickel transport system ATP-binding protein
MRLIPMQRPDGSRAGEPAAAAPDAGAHLAGDELLRIENLHTHFVLREGTVHALDGVDFSIERGKTLGIAGESGCGKSVTALTIMRLLPRTARIVDGRIWLRTKDGSALDLVRQHPEGEVMRTVRGDNVAMIFQEPMTSFSPVHTVGNQIMEAIVYHRRASKNEAREATVELLGKVGIPKPSEHVDVYPFNLSGGMRQRAMIAMALACRPSLLIADEPTTAVDVTIQAQVLELIRDLQSELNMALIIITHDLAVIAELANKVLIMYLGQEVESAPVDDIFYNSKHPYTRGLLASVPKLGEGATQQISAIRGSVPTHVERVNGCLFHPRCPEFMPGVCDTAAPQLQEVGAEHSVGCYLYGGGRDRHTDSMTADGESADG